jgi:hypothetical protein
VSTTSTLAEAPAAQPTLPVRPEPLRVVVREAPAPGQEAQIPESSFEDARSVAAARRSRIGGYLKLPLQAARALGKKVILLDKVVRGEELVLRVRLFPIPQVG